MDIDGKFYCSRCMRPMEENGVCPHCEYNHRGASNTSPALEQGTLLKMRYQLGCMIGKGGFGITYAAWDEALQIPVAIKEYFPKDFVTRNTDYSDEVEVTEGSQKQYLIGLEHFIRESRVLAMMKDISGVVKVQDYFEENNTGYIVMEFVRGVSLREYGLSQEPAPSVVLEKLKAPIDALIVLHKQGVMHRDITPENLMVQEDGSVKLIDFGSAASMNRDQSMIVVTEKYAPIEQYSSTGKGMGAWTDIYGLCATLYEVLTGMEPQESVLRIHKDELVPLDKTKVKLKKYECRALMDGLQVEPEKRPQSMEEFRAKLYNLPMPEEIRRRKQFVRKSALTMGVLLVLAVLTAVNFVTGLPLGEGLLYSMRSDGLHVVSAFGEAECVVMPSSRLGIPVVKIEDLAFAENDTLREVQIPGSVTSIGKMAFFGSDSLWSVTLEEGVTELGEYAFAQCGALRTVYLPESLQDAAENAFDEDSMYLTAWGTKGGTAEAAAEQMGLSFAVQEEYEIAEKEDGTAELVSYTGEKSSLVLPSVIDGKVITGLLREEHEYFALPDTVLELTFPEHLQEIPYYSFCSWGLEEFGGGRLQKAVLGPEVKTIAQGAFDGANLKEIELPDGLLCIGEYALANTQLETIALPDSLEEIEGGAFVYSRIKEITIPDSIQTWGDGIFGACEWLETVNLPDNMTELPERMFADCISLQTLTLPNALTAIRDSAFTGCIELEYLELPDGAETIEQYAFENCRNLKYIYIPASVTSIDDRAFSGCSEELVIGGTAGSQAEEFAKQNGLRFDDQSSWSEDAYVTDVGTVTISADSAEGEDYVILPSYDMEYHTLVRKLNVVQRSNMEQVQLPMFVETIGIHAFAGYTIYGAELQESRLRSVIIPETVEVIEEEAFRQCENLEDVYIYAWQTVISESAFIGCEKLTIHGYRGSDAEAYAKEQGIPFQELEE